MADEINKLIKANEKIIELSDLVIIYQEALIKIVAGGDPQKTALDALSHAQDVRTLSKNIIDE
jgi:hypothetical protein